MARDNIKFNKFMLLFKAIHEKNFKLNIYFLRIIFLSSFLIISYNFSYWVSVKSFFEYSDWLINYQGGFTRRGLIGEILYHIHTVSGIGLNYILFVFVVVAYGVFFFILYKMVTSIKLNFINTLVIFSPLSFIYMPLSKTLAGRKEILFFLLITIFFYKLRKIKFEKVKYWIIFISLVTSLTHLGFIFYIPYLILFFIYLNPDKNLKEISLQILPILMVMFFILVGMLYATIYSKADINIICSSIKDFTNACPQDTYLEVFTLSVTDIMGMVVEFSKNQYFIKYPIYYILSFTPIYLSFFNLKENEKYKTKKLITFLIISSILTLPVFVLGGDYGRYIHWQYICYLLIYIYTLNSKILEQPSNNNFFKNKINYLILSSVIFFYSFFWSVPHCCDKNYSFLYDKIFIRLFIN